MQYKLFKELIESGKENTLAEHTRIALESLKTGGASADMAYRIVTVSSYYRYTYDNVGNLIKVTAPNGGVTSYEYDAAGNILSMTDCDGGNTGYTYDAYSRVQSMEILSGNGIMDCGEKVILAM